MNATGRRPMAQVRVGGTINGYGVVVLGDEVLIERNWAEIARRLARSWAGSSPRRGT
jgi:hypothetical protein